MKRYWTLKLNEATARRINRMTEQNQKVDASTHAGRTLIGYNYVESVIEEE
jgi:hypothetical protein